MKGHMAERFTPTEGRKPQESKTENRLEFSAPYDTPAVRNVMEKRGILRENETPEGVFRRVVGAFMDVERSFGGSDEQIEQLEQDVYRAIADKEIVFGTPILTNAGREGRPTGACVVIPLDLRKSLSEVKKTLAPYFEAAMGNGFDFSQIDDPVKKLDEMNEMTREIEKGCDRPVASMGILRADHPKIMEFIDAKRDADFSEWRFNISVSCSDAFMEAVERDGMWDLKDDAGKVISSTPARSVFERIAASARFCGEPGVLFGDRFDRDNPTPELKYTSVAPCAELAMAPGEVCQLSYINVGRFLKDDGRGGSEVDFGRLREATGLLTRLLDDSVQISMEHSVGDPGVIGAKRRIGIGMCGAADLFVALGLPYDSSEAKTLLKDVMDVINFASKKASVDLAEERGPFPLFASSRYANKSWLMRKAGGSGQVSAEEWKTLVEDITKKGIRNAGTTALAPTGTSSRIAGASTSLEPLFSVTDPSGKMLPQVRLRLEESLGRTGMSEAEIEGQILRAERTGSCQWMDWIPEAERSAWKTAQEISWQAHLDMVSSIQPHVDESISKTINLSGDATDGDVFEAFLQGYRAGLKGVTVFRSGCLAERGGTKKE